MTQQAKDSYEFDKIKRPNLYGLPFRDEDDDIHKRDINTNDVQVIINGHRYNLT